MKTIIVISIALMLLSACTKNDNPTIIQIMVSTPTIYPAGGSYSTTQEVSMTCDTGGATIKYTLDGSEPGSESMSYTVPIMVDTTTVVKAKAFKENWLPSAVATTHYSYQVASIFFSPNGGSFQTPQTVRILTTSPGTVVHYTSDGTEPTIESATYTAPISVDRYTVLKAKGFKQGWAESPAISATYSFNAQMPTFSITPDTYYIEFQLALNTVTPNAVIYYTTDGTEPDESSLRYSNPINISRSTVVKAKTFRQGWTASASATGTYTLKAQTVYFTPAQGSFYQAQSLEINCSTPGAKICYTTNNEIPTSSSQVYTTPIQIQGYTALRAIAVKSGWQNSDVTTGEYRFIIHQPVFSLDSGTYSGIQTISISCKTPGVIIRYTFNGENPDNSSTVYTVPIQISASKTIKARAFKTGYDDSPVTTGEYNITNYINNPVFYPQQGTFQLPIYISLSSTTPQAIIRYTLNGTIPDLTSPLYTGPIMVSTSTLIMARAFYSNWPPSQIISAQYNITFTPDVVFIPGGSFLMGDTQGMGLDNALPTHQVTVSSFYMGEYETTQQEWINVMGSNPSAYTGNVTRPVENVSIYSCMVYCNLKSINDGYTPVYSINGLTNPLSWGTIPINAANTAWQQAVCNWNANGYRLPTEAEWEYAAKGGLTIPDYIYSGSNTLGNCGWFIDNSADETHPVGSKQVNRFGLYDMSGNVWEWCWDWYSPTYYTSNPMTNPTGPEFNSNNLQRSVRGGSFNETAFFCVNAIRLPRTIYNSLNNIGFRIVRRG